MASVSAANGMRNFPRDRFSTPVDSVLVQTVLDTRDANSLTVYYLYIPMTSLVGGALSMTQFDPRFGKNDALLYELFCAAAMRRAGKEHHSKALSRLFVTVLPDPRGRPIGLLFHLYEDDHAARAFVQAAVDEGDDLFDGQRRNRRSKMTPELQLIRCEFDRYAQLMSTLPPLGFYSHLAVMLPDAKKATLEQHWPALMASRGMRNEMQVALKSYSDPANKRLLNVLNGSLNHDENPLRPSAVFTIENAFQRYFNAHGWIYDPIKDTSFDSVAGFLGVDGANWSVTEPYLAHYTFMVPDKYLVPRSMNVVRIPIVRKLDDDDEEWQTPQFQRFCEEFRHGDAPAIELRRLYLDQEALSSIPCYSSVEHFVRQYAPMQLYNSHRPAKLAIALDDFAALMSPSLNEGRTFSKCIEFHSAFLERNQGSYCMGITVPRDLFEEHALGPEALFIATVTQWIGVLHHVSCTHHQIMLIMFYAWSSVIQPRNKEDLQANLVLTGAAAKGKTYALHRALDQALVPDVREALGHRSTLARFISGNERARVITFDEGTAADLDMPDRLRNDFEWFDACVTQSSHSNSDKATQNKMSRTSTEQVAQHNVIRSDGTRETVRNRSIQYGFEAICTNTPTRVMGKASADRAISLDFPDRDMQDHDPLGYMVAARSRTVVPPEMARAKRCADDTLQRIHCLYLRYQTLVAARIVAPTDESGFLKRCRLVANQLSRMGIIDATSARHLTKLLPVAQSITFATAVMLCYDWGIGGPNRARPYTDADIQLLQPLLYIRDQATFFTMELVPVYLPDVQLACIEGIRAIFTEAMKGPQSNASDAASFDYDVQQEGDYIIRKRFFRPIYAGGSAGQSLMCREFANILESRGVPYQNRIIFCELAHFTSPVVPTRLQNGQIVNKPFWRIALNSMDPRERPDLIVHRSVMNKELDRDYMIRAIRASIHENEEERSIMRAVSDNNEFDTFKIERLRSRATAATEAALAEYASELARWEEDKRAIAEELRVFREEHVALRRTDLLSFKAGLQEIQNKLPPKPVLTQRQTGSRVVRGWEFANTDYVPEHKRHRLMQGHIGPLDPLAFEAELRRAQEFVTVSPTLDAEVAAQRLQDLRIVDPDKVHYARPDCLRRCMKAYCDWAWCVDEFLYHRTQALATRVAERWIELWLVYDVHMALPEQPCVLHAERMIAKSHGVVCTAFVSAVLGVWKLTQQPLGGRYAPAASLPTDPPSVVHARDAAQRLQRWLNRPSFLMLSDSMHVGIEALLAAYPRPADTTASSDARESPAPEARRSAFEFARYPGATSSKRPRPMTTPLSPNGSTNHADDAPRPSSSVSASDLSSDKDEVEELLEQASKRPMKEKPITLSPATLSRDQSVNVEAMDLDA